ncbi:MAG: hypothetical protein LBH00_06375 [Planctomycetaceae bacterium]|nr:hypothetical protein [Planctomycetaceae bacterium]
MSNVSKKIKEKAMTKKRILLGLGLMSFLVVPSIVIICFNYGYMYEAGEVYLLYVTLLYIIAFFAKDQSADKKPISGDGAAKKPFGDWADKKPIVWGCEDVRK